MSVEFPPKDLETSRILEKVAFYSEALFEDIVPFVNTYTAAQANEWQSLGAEVPDDYKFDTNMDLDVLGLPFIASKILQKMGGELIIVGQDGDRDMRIVPASTHIPTVAVYKKPSNLDLIMSMISSKGDDRDPGFELLTQLDHYRLPIPSLFDPDLAVSWLNSQELAPIRDSGLLERAFMTKSLQYVTDKLMKAELSSKIVLELDRAFDDRFSPQNYALYQQYAEAGHRPLGLEEVYGMMTTAIRKYIDRHPEFDPKPNPIEGDFV
jgi:hypothetical protein